jgi:hypothetical protein
MNVGQSRMPLPGGAYGRRAERSAGPSWATRPCAKASGRRRRGGAGRPLTVRREASPAAIRQASRQSAGMRGLVQPGGGPIKEKHRKLEPREPATDACDEPARAVGARGQVLGPCDGPPNRRGGA